MTGNENQSEFEFVVDEWKNLLNQKEHLDNIIKGYFELIKETALQISKCKHDVHVAEYMDTLTDFYCSLSDYQQEHGDVVDRLSEIEAEHSLTIC